MAKEVTKRLNIWVNGKQVENNLKSIRSAIVQTTNELNRMTVGSDEYIAHSKKLTELKQIYQNYRDELKLTENDLSSLSKRHDDTILKAGALATVISTASSAYRRFVSATQEYVDAYASLDDAMTNVSKYTGLTREEVKQLNEEFQKMDTRTPTEKLNALAADAGRLGITSKEAIKDFVEAADIINVALY